MALAGLLALDVGTSGCRAEVFALDGRSLGRHYAEYGVLSPEPGAAEQEPEQWWEAIVSCTHEARRKTAEPVRLLAVGLSVQGHTWALTDSEGRPLRPAMTWLDTRAAAHATRLLAERGPELWGTLAGKLPGPWHLLCQLLWLRDREPATVARAARYLFAHDYLLLRLTGRAATDLTQAATSLLFDIARGEWAAELPAAYDIPASALSPVMPAGAVAGPVLPETAAALGLEPEALVAVGAQDQKCAALAAGLEAGTATISLGTAVAIAAPVSEPRFDPALGAIPCFPWLRPGEWVLEAPMTTGGGAFRWLRDLLDDGSGTSFERLVAAADELPPGAEGVRFFPYLAGAGAPHWRSEARAAFTGMTLRTGRGHLTRAVLEGVACDIRENLDCMSELGCPLERLRLFGGGTRGTLWPRIIAAVTALPTEVCAEAEAATRGAAMLAAEALAAEPRAFALTAERVRVTAEETAQYAAVLEAYRMDRGFGG